MQYLCELIELDFEKGTATFQIPENSQWTAGKYLIAGRDVQSENESGEALKTIDDILGKAE